MYGPPEPAVRTRTFWRQLSRRCSITPEEVEELTARLREDALFRANPQEPPRVVPNAPNDDYLVALALRNDAAALSTRDKHFDAAAVPGLRILTPRAFLKEFGRLRPTDR